MTGAGEHWGNAGDRANGSVCYGKQVSSWDSVYLRPRTVAVIASEHRQATASHTFPLHLGFASGFSHSPADPTSTHVWSNNLIHCADDPTSPHVWPNNLIHSTGSPTSTHVWPNNLIHSALDPTSVFAPQTSWIINHAWTTMNYKTVKYIKHKG